MLLLPGVNNLEISINEVPANCEQKEIIGATKVTCPVSVKSDYFVKFSFDTSFPLVSLDERKLFSQDLNFNTTIEKFTFRLKLPERAILPEETSKFVTPEPTKLYSDGRRIILAYEVENAESFRASVIYESAKKSPVAAFLAILFLIAIVFGLALYKFKSKAKTETREKPRPEEAKIAAEKPMEIAKAEQKEEKLYLLPDEKGIIYILKQAGKPIRQRDIEKQITFSKAKLSRVLRGLEERGIIKRIPRGNTNLVELIKQ